MPRKSLVPERDTMFTRPPAARPNSGANWLVTTWNSRTASWLSVRRVLPLSAPLASTPSREMLLLRARWPLKLMPLPWPLICWPVTPATSVEKLRKSRPLLGRFSISVRDTTAPVCVRPGSMTGASAVTVTSWLTPGRRQRDVHRQHLADLERQAGPLDRGEAVERHRERVGAGRNGRDAVAAGLVGHRGPLDAGVDVGQDQRRTGQHPAGGIADDASDVAGGSRLRVARRRADRRERKEDNSAGHRRREPMKQCVHGRHDTPVLRESNQSRGVPQVPLTRSRVLTPGAFPSAIVQGAVTRASASATVLTQ